METVNASRTKIVGSHTGVKYNSVVFRRDIDALDPA
jgi:hypothetical protein